MYEDDFQPEEDGDDELPQKTINPPKKPAKKDDDFAFLDDADDVDFGIDGEDGDFEEEPGSQDGGLMPKELTTAENLSVFNNSIKSTQYMRKNKPNIVMFNNLKHFNALF